MTNYEIALKLEELEKRIEALEDDEAVIPNLFE